MNVSDSIRSVVEGALKQHVAQVQEEAIKDALRDFESDLRRAVGNYAINLANYYSVERMGPELVIRVNIGKEDR